MSTREQLDEAVVAADARADAAFSLWKRAERLAADAYDVYDNLSDEVTAAQLAADQHAADVATAQALTLRGFTLSAAARPGEVKLTNGDVTIHVHGVYVHVDGVGVVIDSTEKP